MPLFELSRDAFIEVPRTTMQDQSLKEREDIQRVLKNSISVIGSDLLVIAEEFSQWQDSRRRIDLLAIDKSGNLVVIELKRVEDGGHMDLQAIRYAAMVSTMTFQQALEAFAEFRQEDDLDEARKAILTFLQWQEPQDDFASSVRIILVSPDYSKELTTTVMWLNDRGLDIQCIRIRPYSFQDRTIVDVEQIIPLREAEDYTVRLKEKKEEIRRVTSSTIDFSHYDLSINGTIFPNLWKRQLIWRVISSAIQAGVSLHQLESILPRRGLLVVEGKLNPEEFLEAAKAKRASEGYTFDSRRYFLDDDRLLYVDGKTCALSNQWGIGSLPMIDDIIAILPPEVKMSYSRVPSRSDVA